MCVCGCMCVCVCSIYRWGPLLSCIEKNIMKKKGRQLGGNNSLHSFAKVRVLLHLLYLFTIERFCFWFAFHNTTSIQLRGSAEYRKLSRSPMCRDSTQPACMLLCASASLAAYIYTHTNTNTDTPHTHTTHTQTQHTHTQRHNKHRIYFYALSACAASSLPASS